MEKIKYFVCVHFALEAVSDESVQYKFIFPYNALDRPPTKCSATFNTLSAPFLKKSATFNF